MTLPFGKHLCGVQSVESLASSAFPWI